MLRRDLEIFFFGTAMTRSPRRPTPAKHPGASPKNAAAALYRRGGPTSLAKSLHPRNNLAAAARFVSEGGEARKRVLFALFGGRPAPPSDRRGGLGQDILERHPRPPRVRIGRQGELFGDDFADI